MGAYITAVTINQKSIPDHHPIACIQNILESLCGSAWFSVLDEGKAHHQAFQDKSS